MKYKLITIACFIGLSLISTSSFSQRQKFVINTKIYYDAHFNPRVEVVYQNVYKKDISQVMSAFIYNDFAQWDNTSMKRNLVEATTVRIIRNINIPVGKTSKDDFAIPPLEGYESKTPLYIRISKIRYSDGSVQTFD